MKKLILTLYIITLIFCRENSCSSKPTDTCQADSIYSWNEAGCYSDTRSTYSSVTQQSKCVDTKYVGILYQQHLMHVQVSF